MKNENTALARKWMFEVLGNTKFSIIILTILQTAQSVLTATYPIVMLQIYTAIEEKNRILLDQKLQTFILFIIAQLILWAIISRYLEVVRLKMNIIYREKILDAWLNKRDISNSALHTGELLNRFTSDIDTVINGCITILPNILSLTIRLLVTTTYLYMLLPDVATGMVIGGAILFVFSVYMKRITKKLHKQTLEADGKVRSYVQEVFQQLPVIRSFGVEEYIEENNHGLLMDFRKIALKRNAVLILVQLCTTIIFNIAIVFGTYVASNAIMDGILTIGKYIAISQLIMQVRAPLSSLIGFIPQYFRMTASAERLYELIEDNQEHDIHAPKLREPDCIDFDSLDFIYNLEENKVLRDFNLKIQKGKHLGIVGESGSGKSTFLKILTGIYVPRSGTITLKYKDSTLKIDDSNVYQYRQLFSYVPQGSGLLSGTIRDCIVFGHDSVKDKDEIDKSVIDEEVYKALEIACAKSFVDKLPKGIDSEIKESGNGLSIGQIQRIIIARAIYAKRPFLVLDEASSALDKKTEKQLLENLKKMTDITLIIVTHRLEMLEICSQVYNFNAHEEE